VHTNDASAFPAEGAFRAATINGAQALGLSHLIGSLEVGKQADFIAISLDGIHMQPMFDPVSHLVYTASRADVTHVYVGGCARVNAGTLGSDAQRAINDSQVALNEFTTRVAALAKT
jgi:5-methylthioadenosine/S-adenosylhomocysteine deaminase